MHEKASRVLEERLFLKEAVIKRWLSTVSGSLILLAVIILGFVVLPLIFRSPRMVICKKVTIECSETSLWNTISDAAFLGKHLPLGDGKLLPRKPGTPVIDSDNGPQLQFHYQSERTYRATFKADNAEKSVTLTVTVPDSLLLGDMVQLEYRLSMKVLDTNYQQLTICLTKQAHGIIAKVVQIFYFEGTMNWFIEDFIFFLKEKLEIPLRTDGASHG